MKIYICEVFQRCMFLHSVGLDLNMRFDDKKKSISCDKSVKKFKKKRTLYHTQCLTSDWIWHTAWNGHRRFKLEDILAPHAWW